MSGIEMSTASSAPNAMANLWRSWKPDTILGKKMMICQTSCPTTLLIQMRMILIICG
jgi:hypothetical protein